MENKVKLILGTMNFGPQVNEEDSKKMLKSFVDAGFNELDTAYVYNNGDTEKILGSIVKDFSSATLSVATKVNPRITGKLDSEAIYMQFSESLERMDMDSVDLLYFHFPDPVTPIDSALEACATLHKEGKFKELGLSNYPAWNVVDVFHRCKETGCPEPTVYQGMYNGLTRGIEEELFPAIRHLGMRFYAFNPLAGGILSGKYKSFEDLPEDGRFSLRPNYKKRYWKESFFNAINLLSEKCREEDITLPEASFRWMAYHSQLDNNEGDGIIIGASKVHHLEQNILAVEKGPLPEKIVSTFEEIWASTKAESPQYFRYSSK